MRVIEIDPWSPRKDLVQAAAATIAAGGLVAVPTDTTWAVIGDALDRTTLARLAALRRRMSGEREDDLDPAALRPMSIICASFAMIGTWVVLDQPRFRLVRRLLPGPYTIILPASREVPRLIQSKRRAIGIRMPDHLVPTRIVEALARPVLTITAHLDAGTLVQSSSEFRDLGRDAVDLVVDSEPIEPAPSTVVDCTGDLPALIRLGRGDPEPDWIDASTA